MKKYILLMLVFSSWSVYGYEREDLRKAGTVVGASISSLCEKLSVSFGFRQRAYSDDVVKNMSAKLRKNKSGERKKE